MREIAQLSVYEDGPRRAQARLADHGIALVVERHLPRTHLDGAALCLQDGRPVIGLTLRYDRIDNFWFSLMHELAHVGLHLDCDENELFIDDLSLSGGDPLEEQADSMARNALIPPRFLGIQSDTWKGHGAGCLRPGPGSPRSPGGYRRAGAARAGELPAAVAAGWEREGSAAVRGVNSLVSRTSNVFRARKPGTGGKQGQELASARREGALQRTAGGQPRRRSADPETRVKAF